MMMPVRGKSEGERDRPYSIEALLLIGNLAEPQSQGPPEKLWWHEALWLHSLRIAYGYQEG